MKKRNYKRIEENLNKKYPFRKMKKTIGIISDNFQIGYKLHIYDDGSSKWIYHTK